MINSVVYSFIPKGRKFNFFMIKTFLDLLYSSKNEIKKIDFKRIKLNEILQDLPKIRFLFNSYLKERKRGKVNRNRIVKFFDKINRSKRKKEFKIWLKKKLFKKRGKVNRNRIVKFFYKINRSKRKKEFKIWLKKREDLLFLSKIVRKKKYNSRLVRKFYWYKTILNKISLRKKLKKLERKKFLFVAQYLYLIFSNFIKSSQRGNWYKIILQIENKKLKDFQLNFKYSFLLHKYKIFILKKERGN